MKKIVLMIFVAATLFSCQKENLGGLAEDNASAMQLTINVNRTLTKAVEDGHPGQNDDKVSPKLLSVTVLTYDNAGVELGATDLTADQIKQAVWGYYQVFEGGAWKPGGQRTKPTTGAKIGLPKGSKRVDVVINRAPAADYKPETNINYFNYRDNKNGQNGTYNYGADNFDRVVLATSNYGIGTELGTPVVGPNGPVYSKDFSVKPYLARMEVHGGINVALEEVWTDVFGNKWKTMTVTVYEQTSGDTPDSNGNYPKGAVKGTAANGFDLATVYIPEYYWFQNNSLDEPATRVQGNTYASEADVPQYKAGWVPQPHYNNTAAVQVNWLPNRYYAVDVESIFVNNIKVQSIERTPYMHQWPGSEVSTGWPDWYKAFHIGGWHSSGSSSGNTYLCMGNMWDPIAEADNPATGYKKVPFPEIGGVAEMNIIVGKAKPITGKSKYYDDTNRRNLGVFTNKAAAYVIYPQTKQSTTGTTEGAKLRHELPHIILKVKVYENATTYAAGQYITGKEFITLSLFSNQAQGNGTYVTNFDGGNIYRFDLNELLYSFVGNVPVPGGRHPGDIVPIDPVDPDPEMPESELTMTVEVKEWIIQNMFPVI